MGEWNHPQISLEDLLKLIKGFVDILILASGYQSSGRFAHWDPQNVRKAFQWGIFFENVFKSIDDCQDSADEFDAALSKLTSDPHFPQGLKHMSSATLSKARSLVLQHLTRTLPMRDAHLEATLKATVEMDLDELQRTEMDYLNVYLDKLMVQKSTRGLVKEVTMDFSPTPPNPRAENPTDSDLTTFAIGEITKRQRAVSCVSSIEMSFDLIAKTVTQRSWEELDNNLLQEQQENLTASVWSYWRTKNLSYLLDKRTIRLVSGAKMIFSAPKVQWVRVFEGLDESGEANANFCETIELLLAGCVSSKWNRVVEHFVSNSHQSVSISTIYDQVHNLILGRFHNSESMAETNNSKEQEIVEYLEEKLSNQLHHLWELSPALTAGSIPAWSNLFKVYASELASQFKGKTTKNGCCSCMEDNKEHTECEVAERIWCLYIFHVCGY